MISLLDWLHGIVLISMKSVQNICCMAKLYHDYDCKYSAYFIC